MLGREKLAVPLPVLLASQRTQHFCDACTQQKGRSHWCGEEEGRGARPGRFRDGGRGPVGFSQRQTSLAPPPSFLHLSPALLHRQITQISSRPFLIFFFFKQTKKYRRRLAARSFVKKFKK